jgi:hypothetical protein
VWKSVVGRVAGRSGARASRRRWPAEWRVRRYGALLPMEAMKRRRMACRKKEEIRREAEGINL